MNAHASNITAPTRESNGARRTSVEPRLPRATVVGRGQVRVPTPRHSRSRRLPGLITLCHRSLVPLHWSSDGQASGVVARLRGLFPSTGQVAERLKAHAWPAHPIVGSSAAWIWEQGVDNPRTYETQGAGDIPARLQQALGDAYTVESEIGRGGMATVYRAYDGKHDRRVALKVLSPDVAHALGPERFRREIRLVAGLQHPHILPVFDSGEADGLLWFTMPLVQGESLRDRLVRERQLPAADSIRLTREIASALDYAHRHGVVHRDIKPENILLTADGQTLLADFGVARRVDAPGAGTALTGTGVSVGTPAYMSPEQGAGERDVDGRSDQYSLACVLYECLAGEPPFIGATPQAVFAKRFAGPAPDVGVLRSGTSPGVRAALARALGTSPADRFPTAAAFAAALTDGGRVDAAHTAESAPPVARRWRGTTVAAVSGVVAIMLGVAAVQWRARSDRDGVATGAAPGAATVSATVNIPSVTARQLTFSGIAQEPEFSRDGREIVYVETRCDSAVGVAANRCTASLRVQDVGSGQFTVLVTADAVRHPHWSADGAWVVALMWPAGEELGTYLVPHSGGAARRIGPPAIAEFSAKGDTVLIAAIAAPGAPRFVRRVRATTGETLDSTPLPRALTALQGLHASPDGKWFALRLEDRLLLATPDRRVTDTLMFRNAGSLRWDSSGDALYAVVPGAGISAVLVRARVDGRHGRFAGGIDTVLNLGAASSSTFDIAPDGRKLVFSGGTATMSLWALDLATRPLAPRRLAASTSLLGVPFLSSDGQLVGYTATDQAGDNVYVIPFAGGSGQPVTHDAAGWEAQGWVPGGHRLTYNDAARPTDLFAQDVPDGLRRVIGRVGARPLADGGTVELDAPGRHLVFRTNDGKERLVALPDSLDGFKTLWAADADGSGAYLVYSAGAPGTPARIRIIRIDRASGAIAAEVELAVFQFPQALAVDHGAMVYATWAQFYEASRPTLWRARRGQRPAMVSKLPLECNEGTLTMSADGQRFTCARWTGTSDLFQLENFDRYRR